MLKRLTLLLFALLPAAALAQSAASVVPGFMSPAGTNGCPTTTSCFVPFSGVSGPGAAQSRHFSGCSVGVASAQCLAAATAKSFVQVQNASASGGATIACNWGSAAVLNDKGSFQLQPGQAASWGPNTAGLPSGALNCIASGGATQLWLEWN